MNHCKQIEIFNHHLEAQLYGDEADPGDLEDTDLQALGIARRLAALDLSTQSKQRYMQRRKLTQNARLCTQTIARSSLPSSLQPPALLTMALPGATLLFVLVFVLSWTLANLRRLPDTGDLVSATAYAMSGTTIESGLPPQVNNRAMQTLPPQPLPTPLAPRQSTTHVSSTSGPGQTPSQASLRAGPLGPTQVKP